jgi:hypothetical protein
MSLKLKEEMNHLFLSNALIDDDDDYCWIVELGTLAKNNKKEVIGVIDIFPSFLKRYDEKKTYNTLAFMLDPRFKS